ncbi:MAG: adenylosuccinate synthetase, partial [Novosphingobium sp.]
VHHPMTLGQELAALAELGADTTITADPRGYVTTPWDMLVNQLAERSRGAARHGSCGYGFGETVGRGEETAFGLTLSDLADPRLYGKLTAIRDRWAPARLAALGMDALSGDDRALLASDAILDSFLADCAGFLERVRIVPDAAIGAAPAVVLEGAQGLLLDQRHGAFPYVTRSNTGLANMLEVAAEAGIERIDAVYATRCYLTRHGRGPMPNEGDVARSFAVDDPTNRPNPWQERLRFGELDLAVLGGAVRRDVAKARGARCEVVPHLAVTCLDQARGKIPFRYGDRRAWADPPALIAAATATTGTHRAAAAHGPTRATADLDPILERPRRVA